MLLRGISFCVMYLLVVLREEFYRYIKIRIFIVYFFYETGCFWNFFYCSNSFLELKTIKVVFFLGFETYGVFIVLYGFFDEWMY